MKKFISMTSVLTLSTLLMASHAVRADETIAPPVSVENYQPDNSPIESIQLGGDEKGPFVDPTADQIERYLQDKHAAEAQDGLGEEGNDFRMSNFKDADAAGKIVVIVHKSKNPKIAEYLQVFKQMTADPSSMVPQNVFEGGKSSKCLVSTAGTYSGHVYSTPSGYFGIDSLEVMHHSSAYNNAPMPWTEFFNGGIALHGATPSEFSHLGQKASHGCVRMHPDNAHLLFNFVKALSGGKSEVVVNVRES